MRYMTNYPAAGTVTIDIGSRAADNRHVHRECQEERHAHDDEENTGGMNQRYHALVTAALTPQCGHFDDPARHAGKEGRGVTEAAYRSEVNVADRVRNLDVDRDSCERYWPCKQLAKRIRREGTSQHGSVRQEDRYPRYGPHRLSSSRASRAATGAARRTGAPQGTGTNGNRETRGSIPAFVVSVQGLHGDAFRLGISGLGTYVGFPVLRVDRAGFARGDHGARRVDRGIGPENLHGLI